MIGKFAFGNSFRVVWRPVGHSGWYGTAGPRLTRAEARRELDRCRCYEQKRRLRGCSTPIEYRVFAAGYQ